MFGYNIKHGCLKENTGNSWCKKGFTRVQMYTELKRIAENMREQGDMIRCVQHKSLE